MFSRFSVSVFRLAVLRSPVAKIYYFYYLWCYLLPNSTFKSFIISLRPKQWSKNIIVFAGLFFAEDIFDVQKIKAAILAFIYFCLVSSAGYLINDVLDRKKDALHPLKKNRPIAAGRLSIAAALGGSGLLFAFSLFFSYQINQAFGLIIFSYFILTVIYSLWLKRIIIIDVIVISTGFMLRTIGGTVAINEIVSSWLIICTIFLALFLALNKRHAEITAVRENASKMRKTLALYSPAFLGQMINIVTAACLMAYALYTLDPETVNKFGTRNLVFTLPFVIYGLFRYLFLVLNDNVGESPESVLTHDLPTIVNMVLYAVTVVIIIYH